MDPKTQEQIDELTVKVEAIYKSVEKTRRYIQWSVGITILLFALPFLGLLFAIPALIDFASVVSNFKI